MRVTEEMVISFFPCATYLIHNRAELKRVAKGRKYILHTTIPSLPINYGDRLWLLSKIISRLPNFDRHIRSFMVACLERMLPEVEGAEYMKRDFSKSIAVIKGHCQGTVTDERLHYQEQRIFARVDKLFASYSFGGRDPREVMYRCCLRALSPVNGYMYVVGFHEILVDLYRDDGEAMRLYSGWLLTKLAWQITQAERIEKRNGWKGIQTS